MTRITPEDVRKVSKLARLDIPEESIQTYANQLEKILEYIEHLQKVDTKNVLPTTRAVEVVYVLREDFVQTSKIKEDILDLAAEREGKFYRFPKILSE